MTRQNERGYEISTPRGARASSLGDDGGDGGDGGDGDGDDDGVEWDIASSGRGIPNERRDCGTTTTNWRRFRFRYEWLRATTTTPTRRRRRRRSVWWDTDDGDDEIVLFVVSVDGERGECASDDDGANGRMGDDARVAEKDGTSGGRGRRDGRRSG
jgi:hypothetical protein